MSADYRACIMVGVQQEEIKDNELFDRLLEDGIFSMGNNHYVDPNDWDVIGFMKEQSDNTEEISFDAFEYESLRQKFFGLTGMWPKIYLTLRCI